MKKVNVIKNYLFLGSLYSILIIAIYFQVVHFDFLNAWDDQWFVTNYYTEDGLNWKNISAIFTEYYKGQYAPINQLYYTGLYYIFGYNKLIFHVASLVIHLLNTLLVYNFSKKIIKADHIHSKEWLPVFIASLFAILPINVEPVAWVSASKVLIYAFFYLLSLNLYLKYFDLQKGKYFLLTIATFILSFFAKEQAVTLPLALVAIDWIKGRDLKNKDVVLEKLPFFILSLLFGLVTLESQEIQDGASNFYPFYQRIPLSIFTLFEYFTKSIIPINLSYLYPFPFQNGENVPWWMWIYVISIPIFLWNSQYIKDKLIIFAVCFFLIHILLVCNITSLARHSLIADRYAYVATVGICFVIARVFQLLYIRYSKATSIIGGLYVLFLLYYSFNYVQSWKNAYSVKSRLKNTIESRSDFKDLKKE